MQLNHLGCLFRVSSVTYSVLSWPSPPLSFTLASASCLSKQLWKSELAQLQVPKRYDDTVPGLAGQSTQSALTHNMCFFLDLQGLSNTRYHNMFAIP